MYPPSPLINVAGFFFNKKERKSPDYEHCKWGRGELTSCPNVFVWDCSLNLKREVIQNSFT